jgi:hypothetical protein
MRMRRGLVWQFGLVHGFGVLVYIGSFLYLIANWLTYSVLVGNKGEYMTKLRPT